MKTLLFAIILALMSSHQAPGQSPAKKPDATIDPKMRHEVLEMEKNLAAAIESNDADALDAMLADYFADAYGDSETAANKTGMIRSCKAGTLVSYRFGESPKLSRSGEMIAIEGVAKPGDNSSTDNQEQSPLVRVRRIWIQKDGHWLLVAQMRYPFEERSSAGEDKTRRP